jgi:acetylornithine/N-succinyldiaminopimelate aminotransferase
VTSHLLPTYARVDLAFERGEGAWLIATNGERYLDFTGGVAVNGLGHAHPYLIDALNAQAHKLWHVSNLYRIPEAERLAERLCAATFADLVFFCNSGAEAMECAIKVARKYQFAGGHPERYRIITFEGAFHGRTLATLAAGGQKKYLEGFGPVVPGFDQVPFGDFEAVKTAIGPETAARPATASMSPRRESSSASANAPWLPGRSYERSASRRRDPSNVGTGLSAISQNCDS